MHRLTALTLIMSLAACTTNGQRIDRLASSAGLARSEIEAEGYRSLIYMKQEQAAAGATLVVFLEGDGRPWDGSAPSEDPTTSNPVALKLLLKTPGSGAYITRPCYQDLRSDGCTTAQWTAARYSEQIVASMSVAVREAMRRAAARDVVLVGYSGGGTLAVLIAERLDTVGAVVTIAANLDTDAWAAHRRFLPLDGSLNPAASERAHSWPELHLQGAKDAVVPLSTTGAYFQRRPNARRQIIDEYEHVCCWVGGWPALWAQVEEKLKSSRSVDR